jgi:DUF1009 family protein
MSETPDTLALIAGRGDYPLLLSRNARKQGVQRIVALAFRGETSRDIHSVADEVVWCNACALAAMLNALRQTGAQHVAMAGQINPKNLFHMRLDKAFVEMLKALKVKNAHTIFGAIIERIEALGMTILPACQFMQDYVPSAGLLTARAPDERELNDIRLGRRVIKDTSHLDIGQTVVVKEGMILAVEAFEGTNRAIRRGGKLGGKGAVVIKVPKIGHDMRFDIPVVGLQTLKALRKAGISCLALEEGGAIILERDVLIERANAFGMAVVVLSNDDASADV